jgi:hypothetical protein
MPLGFIPYKLARFKRKRSERLSNIAKVEWRRGMGMCAARWALRRPLRRARGNNIRKMNIIQKFALKVLLKKLKKECKGMLKYSEGMSIKSHIFVSFSVKSYKKMTQKRSASC